LEIFETIAKEGRKFGASLGLVSQRPSELNRTILAQCANFIVLKMTNDTDKQMIKNILPEGSKGMIDSINLFKSGDCLIAGDCSQITFKINIDLPNEAPKSETINTWDSWKQPNKLDINKLVNELLDEY
jgi:DNA helicase HerA-like ATPase